MRTADTYKLRRSITGEIKIKQRNDRNPGFFFSFHEQGQIFQTERGYNFPKEMHRTNVHGGSKRDQSDG